jgi:hypothetical protein
MSNSTLKILPALMVAITAGLVTQPVFSQAPAPTPHDLEFIENSSTSLSVTYDGSTTGITVVNSSADLWSVLLPPTLVFSLNPTPAWIEPDNFAHDNFVLFTSGSGTVFSDTPLTFTPTLDEFPVAVGFDTSDQLPIFATFDDDGDVATVPDTGTTFSLFGLSLVGLAFLRRKLC